MQFDKESKRVYQEVDNYSNLYWASRDEFELIRAGNGLKSTRSKRKDSERAESK